MAIHSMIRRILAFAKITSIQPMLINARHVKKSIQIVKNVINMDNVKHVRIPLTPFPTKKANA